MNITKSMMAVALMVAGTPASGGSEMRWQVNDDGTGIEWNIAADKNLPHEDRIEMAGLGVALILDYGVDTNGLLTLTRELIWPSLRIQPNNTYGQYKRKFDSRQVPYITMDGVRIIESPERISFDGVMNILSKADRSLRVTRRIFPAREGMMSIELIEVTNVGDRPCKVEAVEEDNNEFKLGCTGRYISNAKISPAGKAEIAPGKTAVFTLRFAARRVDFTEPKVDGKHELAERRRRVEELTASPVLETGDKVLDTEFRLAKIRTGESIFHTRGGVFHSPGGHGYYAATWCNDQVEYAGPWFAMTGDELAMKASFNAYRHYMPFMADDYQPIPSSVIAEGFDIWNGRGDRGDAAMWAYGASRFVLASGRKDWAKELLPGIRWTLEYCRRRLNAAGVVASDTDELEMRLPAGDANLNTSSLYYDALLHAASVEAEVGDLALAAEYRSRAQTLAEAIDRHFGCEMHGFRTYRYYEGCKVLRSWIGTPLCMGINERASDTAKALFSPYLWIGDGVLCAEGDNKGVTWDRSLLYAIRGTIYSGYADAVVEYLRKYSASRLLGEHVPYPVEAWPEGGRRHLAAESALYCRIFTEGMFGINPTGFGTFDMKANLPKGIKQAKLRNFRAFGKTYDLIATPGKIEKIETR